MELRIVIFLISTVAYSFGDYIQLENKTHIACIVDNPHSVMYVIPPTVQSSKNSAMLLYDDKQWNDWSLKHSTEVVVPYVLDKRWEDFATIYTNIIHGDNLRSFGFSCYGGNLNMTVSVPSIPKPTKKNKFQFWEHYNTYPTYKNSSFQFKAEAQTNVYWKIHDYQLRWAEHISTTPTSIPVSEDDTCLVVYIYLCSYCKLEVAVPGHRYSFHGIEEDLVWQWQSRQIKLNSATNITFIRTTFNGSIVEGQWGVDIRRCPDMVNNNTIYSVNLEDDAEEGISRVCDISQPVISNNIFTCKPGIFGGKCDISCEELLGPDAKYCEKHKLCSVLDSNCLCAWGFKGESCDQACSSGEWGLSCRNFCQNCNTCKAATGECTSSSVLFYASFQTLILMAVLLIQI